MPHKVSPFLNEEREAGQDNPDHDEDIDRPQPQGLEHAPCTANGDHNTDNSVGDLP